MASRKFLVDVEVDGKIEVTGKVSGSNIGDPTRFYETRVLFPTVGETLTLYVDKSTNFIYT